MTPVLEFAFSFHVELAAPIELASGPDCRRRFVPITGGSITGPRLSGRILPGGGDWQVLYPDGTTRVEARYNIEAEDGQRIELSNPGIRVASPEVAARLARGESVSVDEYLFRTTPRFANPVGRHEWLGRTIFVGCGTRNPEDVRIEFYSVG